MCCCCDRTFIAALMEASVARSACAAQPAKMSEPARVENRPQLATWLKLAFLRSHHPEAAS